jgi:hypothetical protein
MPVCIGNLAKVVEVVLVVDPAKRGTLVDAICLVDDITDVSTLTMIQHAFEEL